MARAVDENERASGSHRIVGIDRERLLRLDLDPGDVVARQRRIGRAGLAPGDLAQIEPTIDALDPRGDVARTMPQPELRARPRRLVVEPGEVGTEAAGDAGRCIGGDDQVAARDVELAIQAQRHRLAGEGLVQPAVKCRGPEYLRIIYGPDYDAPGNLERLRRRSVGAKRGLALREFALGVEGLERFVRREPLRAVHECAFAVLALESEPVDPRL